MFFLLGGMICFSLIDVDMSLDLGLEFLLSAHDEGLEM